MTIEEQYKQARALFKRFQDREPRGDSEIIQVGGLAVPTVALAMGPVVGIGYNRIADGKDYFHRFEESRPVLYVKSDGSQLYILAGGYRVTERGIVG